MAGLLGEPVFSSLVISAAGALGRDPEPASPVTVDHDDRQTWSDVKGVPLRSKMAFHQIPTFGEASLPDQLREIATVTCS